MDNKSLDIEPQKSSFAISQWEHLGRDVPFTGEGINKAPEVDRITPVELPATSPNSTCRSLLRYIRLDNRMNDVKSFIEASQTKTYDEVGSTNGFLEVNPNYINNLQKNLTPEDQSALKSYTGFDYKLINQVSRGHWSYNTLGQETPEKTAKAKQAIERISKAIISAPAPSTNFTAYRGTNLDTFNGYDVDKLSDLQNLKHQFFLETGFTSTSLNQNIYFTDREFNDPLRKPCNIEIKYLIPKDHHSGVCLISNNLSWNPEQDEFLLNRYSLSYISDVKIDSGNNRASMEMILIPNAVYERPPEE